MNKDKLKPKLFSVMKGYNGKQFARDVVSGIIVAIIALPLSIALALASGVSPEQGIYTAIFAGFVILHSAAALVFYVLVLLYFVRKNAYRPNVKWRRHRHSKQEVQIC